MAVVSMKQLLEAGVHFGHQTRRWNPKMKRFIFGERNGIYIIDLNQTLTRIEGAYTFVRDLTADGGSVLFIGTKKQTQDPIASYAKQCGMPYINERWLGGMLTNFSTIASRVKKMQEYERMKVAGDFEAMPKKEALILSRELEKLQRNLGGIRGMSRLPEAVFIIDTKKEHLAVTEANKLGIPVVAVVDTNCDPDLVQYVIPGNDDAIRSGNLLCRVISDAVEEGRFIASRKAARSGAPAEVTQGPAPLTAEQQARRDAEQAEAQRQFGEQARDREARLAAARSAPAAEVDTATLGMGEAAADMGETGLVIAPDASAAPSPAAPLPATTNGGQAGPAVDPATLGLGEPAADMGATGLVVTGAGEPSSAAAVMTEAPAEVPVTGADGPAGGATVPSGG